MIGVDVAASMSAAAALQQAVESGTLGYVYSNQLGLGVVRSSGRLCLAVMRRNPDPPPHGCLVLFDTCDWTEHHHHSHLHKSNCKPFESELCGMATLIDLHINTDTLVIILLCLLFPLLLDLLQQHGRNRYWSYHRIICADCGFGTDHCLRPTTSSRL